MAIEVFNRYENKYMVDDGILNSLQNRLADYMELDAYNKKHEFYTVSNLYYDTDDNYLIRTSLQKPKYKEKLRMRAYGVPAANDKVYVEIKKKVCGLVNKRRSGMKLNEAYAFLQSGELPRIEPYMNKQVLCETQYMLEQHALKPKVYLAYDRKAYFGVGQHDLRISFDTNIRTRRTDVKLEAGDYGQRLLEEGKWLMEIKSRQSIPVWLTRLLSEYSVYPAGFSKYGTEYSRSLTQKPTAKTTIMMASAAARQRILQPA